MSKVQLQGNASGTGIFTIASPNSNTDRTLTLPDNTGTLLTQNSQPSFASTIGVGGATPANTGAGITFPATQSASSDANTLDDYEEGSWTATLVSNGGGSVSLQTARYTKVGRLVCVSVENFAVSTTGLSAGTLTITGFPFTTLTGSSPAIAYFQIAGSVSAAQGSVMTYLNAGTTADLYKTESTSPGINNLQVSDLNSSISLRFNGFYYAA